MTPQTKKIKQNPWSDEVFNQVRLGIYHANEQFTSELTSEWNTKVAQRAEQLSNSVTRKLKSNLNVVLFHIKVPESVRVEIGRAHV